MRNRGTSPGPGALIGGKYELVEIAGRGGMAAVWRAILRGDRGFSRTVAVKQIHPHLAEQPTYVDMFVEEARIGAALQDPNIAQTYDFVAENGHYFLVMEWVEGVDLGSYVRYVVSTGVRPRWDLVAAVGIGVLRGLAAAHERVTPEGEAVPIVHRDVSPHNVLLTKSGRAKLIDFGLCLARDRVRDLTDPGVVKGKMAYLSPEVLAGERPTPHSDQFAMGIVLWEALVGRKLFEGATDFEVYKKLRDGKVEPLRPNRPDIPVKLAKLVHRALSAHPARRFPSVRDMAHQLGLVLKSSRAPKDLHAVLAEAVALTRAAMEDQTTTTDRSATDTPVAEPSAELEVAPFDLARHGLLHKVSSFLRGR